MTNGRFVSVRHRALIDSSQSRMSMAYFGAPALQARVSTPPEMVTTNRPSLYRPFTWAEYKATAYSLSLGDNRLDLFINCKDDDHKKLLDWWIFEASSESGHPPKDSFVYNQSMLLLPIYFAHRNRVHWIRKIWRCSNRCSLAVSEKCSVQCLLFCSLLLTTYNTSKLKLKQPI